MTEGLRIAFPRAKDVGGNGMLHRCYNKRMMKKRTS